MKRALPLATLLLAICAFPASAILDTNENGLSDLWEMAYNGGDLFPSMNPQDDEDGDGWTNDQEAVADTNPFDPNPPEGQLQPEITHIPAVWIDTDFDEIPDSISIPEAITLTWPTIVGKQYTLLYSTDLVDWLPVPDETFTGNGNIVEFHSTLDESEKLFWSVAIEDIDSDGDGLTDAEEAALGTNPNKSQTLDGIPDLWLARYFTSILLAGELNTIDPNADPNNDGYTIVQEAFLNFDPNISNTPITGKIGQETIVNGDFSQPAIGSGYRFGVPNPTWDYWGAGGVSGWSAVVGNNIELQNITPNPTADQYVELKAHPVGHYGIQQDVGTRKGATYVLTLDCRDRVDAKPACSDFNVLIDGEIDGEIRCKIRFTVSAETDPLVEFVTPGEWATVEVPFTATKPVTRISLVPVNSLNDTTGCLVANVSVARVDIVPDANMAGVIGDMVRSVNPSSVIKHFVTPQKTEKLNQGFVILKATGITASQITPGNAKQLFEWDDSVGEAVPGDWTKWRVSRIIPNRYPVKIKNKKDGSIAAQLIVWVVWSDVTPTKGIPEFIPCTGGSVYEIHNEPDKKWRFVFKILPVSILDSTTLERPNLSGPNIHPPPGADNTYTITPSKGSGDTAISKWDVSRQYELTIRNPGGIPKADLENGHVPAAWIVDQPKAVNTPVTFPDDVEGNDDPLGDGVDENDNPYSAYDALPELSHKIGEISSCDFPTLKALDFWAAPNRSFSIEMNFKEFARVELWDTKRETGQFWFRISDFVNWHHYLKVTYDDATSRWKDAVSSSDLGHPNH